MLKNLMTAAKRFVNEMELKDIAIMKICLIAFGVLTGLALPKRARRPSAFFAALIFLGTWGTMMFRFLASLTRTKEK
ncbi:MAG: hypothetical protein EOM52_00755 [Clostridia bacterium]|nr:hypothetical protein [Clostridia bacterium]